MRPAKRAGRLFALAVVVAVFLFLLSGCIVKTEMVQLQKEKTTLNVGDRLSLSCSITPADATNQEIEYISSDPGVAKIEGNELVALSEGAATVIALQDNYYFDAYTVTVNPVMPERIFFSATPAELGIGRTSDLSVDMTPANASNKNIVFESSDPAVAQLDGSTLVGVAEGTATVTAKHECGITASFTVHVSPVLLEGLEIAGRTRCRWKQRTHCRSRSAPKM